MFTSIIFEHFLVLVDWTNSPQIKMSLQSEGRRGHDQMVVGFKATYVISDYHHWRCEFDPRPLWCVHRVIKFVSDLWQFSGFLQVLRFPPPIKLTSTILLKWRWNDVKHHKPTTVPIGHIILLPIQSFLALTL